MGVAKAETNDGCTPRPVAGAGGAFFHRSFWDWVSFAGAPLARAAAPPFWILRFGAQGVTKITRRPARPSARPEFRLTHVHTVSPHRSVRPEVCVCTAPAARELGASFTAFAH